MKVALVALVLCLALSGTDAWRGGFGFRGGFGLGFGRWGGWGGWGWGAPWRWGLGPWGWGAGFGVPAVPAAVPAVAPAVAAVGKRDVESVVNTGLVVPPQINNETVCTFAEKKSILSCLGNTFNFECDVIPTHLIDITPAGIRNLTVVVDERIVDGVQVPVFRLFSRVGHVLNDYSLINNEKEVVLTVYHDEKLNIETGIRIADEQCWTAFIRMIKEVVPYIVRFDLVEQQVARA